MVKLLKLGIEIGQSGVAKYMARRRARSAKFYEPNTGWPMRMSSRVPKPSRLNGLAVYSKTTPTGTDHNPGIP